MVDGTLTASLPWRTCPKSGDTLTRARDGGGRRPIPAESPTDRQSERRPLVRDRAVSSADAPHALRQSRRCRVPNCCISTRGKVWCAAGFEQSCTPSVWCRCVAICVAQLSLQAESARKNNRKHPNTEHHAPASLTARRGLHKWSLTDGTSAAVLKMEATAG